MAGVIAGSVAIYVPMELSLQDREMLRRQSIEYLVRDNESRYDSSNKSERRIKWQD